MVAAIPLSLHRKRLLSPIFLCLVLMLFQHQTTCSFAWMVPSPTRTSGLNAAPFSNTLAQMLADDSENVLAAATDDPALANWKSSNLQSSRRSLFQQASVASAMALGPFLCVPLPVSAAEDATKSTQSAEITDKIFLNVKGLPLQDGEFASPSSSSSTTTTRRIVIGLFGKDAPACTAQLKQLVSSTGLPTLCRPRVERTLQREQLEANKVYSSCMESQEKGVPLSYSTIWRIVKDARIDVGAVTGKYGAREFPNWQEDAKNDSTALRHDMAGVVSVRRGNDGGFGFTIYPGSGDGKDNEASRILDEEHIVVGRVLEGMDVVNDLNVVPVIASSKINYMGLTGGPKTKSAPDRSCRYGGNMYCNENKPLIKLSITTTGIL